MRFSGWSISVEEVTRLLKLGVLVFTICAALIGAAIKGLGLDTIDARENADAKLRSRIIENSRSIEQTRLTNRRINRKLDRILCHLEESRNPDPSWERCEQ